MALVALPVAYWISCALEPMPMVGNILLPSGIGPATLRDAQILQLGHLPEASWSLRFGLTILSCLGALALVRLLAMTLHGSTRRDRSPEVFLATVAVLWIAPILISPYFDRYLLPLLPVFMGLTVLPLQSSAAERSPAIPRWAFASAAVLIAAGVSFSVAAMHDYLAWNRARWAAADWLVATRAAPPSAIDGGFEWNAWQGYDPSYVATPGKSWWWVRDDRWVIAFGPIDGRRTVHRVAFPRWLPPGDSGEIVVLERIGGDTPAAPAIASGSALACVMARLTAART
jgi:hypothetical protein